MGRFVKGDIVVLSYPFSDFSETKRRPALVIADLEGDDVILCQITSQAKKDKYAIELQDEDFTDGKLNVKSVIRPNKIFTADSNIILYAACKISANKTDTVIKSIIDVMELKAVKPLVESIKTSIDLMLYNLSISMKTCDWQADISGAKAWRYIYHTIHSCDKFFINPAVYDEPPFHLPDLDWPDSKTDVILDKELMWGYFERTRCKILGYLDSLTDEQLYEIPEKCRQNRLELILGQFKHIYAHIGILNGTTIVHTGQYPHVVNLGNWKKGNLPEFLYAGEERP